MQFYKDDEEVTKMLEGSKSKELINAAKSRMKTLADFKNLISEEESSRKKTKKEKEIAEKLLGVLVKELGDVQWENEKFLAALKNFSKTENIPFKIIYFLLSGKEHGIGLLELNDIYGKDFLIDNLKS